MCPSTAEPGFFDPPTGQYVLRVVGPTDATERLADALPAERIRIEQAEHTMAELKAVADQIIPVRDDRTVDVAALTEPYATLVAEAGAVSAQPAERRPPGCAVPLASLLHSLADLT